MQARRHGHRCSRRQTSTETKTGRDADFALGMLSLRGKKKIPCPTFFSNTSTLQVVRFCTLPPTLFFAKQEVEQTPLLLLASLQMLIFTKRGKNPISLPGKLRWRKKKLPPPPPPLRNTSTKFGLKIVLNFGRNSRPNVS